jgi:hypothetical protein
MPNSGGGQGDGGRMDAMGRPIPGVTVHARQRMMERLGRDLRRDEWIAAVARLLEGAAPLLCRHPTGAEHYLHEVDSTALRLVWIPETAQIVTVLRLEHGASPAVRFAGEGRCRSSFGKPHFFRAGKRIRPRTLWS